MWTRRSYSWKLPPDTFERFSRVWSYYNVTNFSRGNMHYDAKTSSVIATVEALPEAQLAIFRWLYPRVKSLKMLYHVQTPRPIFWKGYRCTTS